jgi:hypothetical protein
MGVIKLNVENVNILYRFVNDGLTIKSKDKVLVVTVVPYTLLKPVYRYTVSLAEVEKRELGIDFLQGETISAEKLSLFEPIKLAEPKLKFELSYVIDRNRDLNTLRLSSVEVIFPSHRSYYVFTVSYLDRSVFDNLLTDLKGIEGKNSLKFLEKEHSVTVGTLQYFEKGLFVVGNLLYTLYSGNYESNLPISDFTVLLNKYGKSFEEVLENVLLAEQVL